jgi:Electron transfer DM13
MKFKYVTLLSLVALLNAGNIEAVFAKQTISPNQAVSAVTKVAMGQSPQTGSFQAGEHPVQGNIRIIRYKNKRYLEFDKSFKTDNGPDLFVILHRDRTVPIYGIKQKDYTSIARLQKTKGTQRYAIPNNVNLADFKSVAVWCRQFNATFGFAALNT